MVRRCSATGRKRKREGKTPTVTEEEDVSKKKNTQEDLSIRELQSLPVMPNVNGKAIFILDNAALKKGLVKKRWKILNSEVDADFLCRNKKDLDDYRSDIVYEALRAILDSPLNKAGMIGAIYVKIHNGPLFEVKPHVRLPRSLKRFCGIILELLEKSHVCTKDTHETLLRVIEEPVTRHLPINSRIICLSYHSEKLVDIEDYLSAESDDLNHVFVVGTMEHGKINKQYTDDFISVSQLPLTAECCVGLICEALEQKRNIL